MAIFCQAELRYLPTTAATADRAVTEVDILDGRVADLPGWQECGFELLQHESAVTDWSDEISISSVHYPEVEELARKLSGAEIALVSNHIRRSPEDALRHQQLSPITFVHSDFAAGHDEIIRRNIREGGDTAPALVRNGVKVRDVEKARRLLILQFWRNLGPAKMDHPLAFCDCRTVRLDQGHSFHVSNYAGSGSNFDALGVAAPAKGSDHQWYVFPELQTTEVVTFRTYDTELVSRGETYFTPHSAFRDPDVEVGKPARTSIELRATCLWL